MGKGRAKQGIFEGNLEEGEPEIGQAASLLHEEQSAAEVIEELMSPCRAALAGLPKAF